MVRLLGLPLRSEAAALDEERYLLTDPLASAVNVAQAKARSVAASAQPDADEIVLAADTLVVHAGQMLGKPVDAGTAREMLGSLRARVHQVLTGVVLLASAGRGWAGVVTTSVTMRAYRDEEIEAYIARGEPFDKAGGYAIQDAAFRPVDSLDGCYLNVVGLPVCAISAGLAALGVEAARTTDARPPCAWCDAGGRLVAIGVEQSR